MRGKERDDENQDQSRPTHQQIAPASPSNTLPIRSPPAQNVPQQPPSLVLPSPQPQPGNVSGSDSQSAPQQSPSFAVPSPQPQPGNILGSASGSAQLRGLVSGTPPPSGVVEDPSTLLEILPPGEICPVCCNFDPTVAPKDGDGTEDRPDWARQEYQIPPGTPAGKISIDQSEKLLEASKGGCLYCCMIQTALRVAHPGWEAEKSFIQVFLAEGLPVVVRLEFGSTSRVTLGREAMLELGVELADGRTMDFIITVGDPEKPLVDIEIYRPRLPPEQVTPGGTYLGLRIPDSKWLTVSTRSCLVTSCRSFRLRRFEVYNLRIVKRLGGAEGVIF